MALVAIYVHDEPSMARALITIVITRGYSDKQDSMRLARVT